MGDSAKVVLDVACSNGLKGVVVALTQDLARRVNIMQPRLPLSSSSNRRMPNRPCVPTALSPPSPIEL